MTLPKFNCGTDNRTFLGKARDIIKTYLITAFIVFAFIGVVTLVGYVQNFRIQVTQAVTSPLAQ